MSIDQELVSAINAKNIERVHNFLDKGANVNSCHEDNEGLYNITPLMFAAQAGDLEIVNLLLQRGADVKLKDRHVMPGEGGGEIALFYAIRAGHETVARRLIEAGSPVEAKAGGTTPLGVALGRKNIGLAKTLVELGAKTSPAMLYYAASDGKTSTVQFLVDVGTDPNFHEKDFGHTPLMEAARRGFLEICQLLLIHGADPNAGDHDGRTALMEAAWGGVIYQLMTDADWAKYGSDPRLIGSCLLTDENVAEIIELLVKHSANIDQKNNFGWTALMVALQEKRTRAAEALLKLGASKQGVGVVDLIQALEKQKSGKEIYDLVRQLPSPNVRGQYGKAIWELVARDYDNRMIRMFVEMGMDPNMTAQDGDPLLKYAIQKGDGGFVKFLVEHGADLRAKDSRGANAKRWARGVKDMSKFIDHLLQETPPPEAPAKDFANAAQSENYRAVVKDLEQRFGTPKSVKTFAFEFAVENASRTVEELRESCLSRGAYLFASRHNSHLAVLPTNDPYDVIRFIETSAPNFDLDTNDIIEFMQNLEAEHPFILTGIGHDFLSGRFTQPIKNSRKLAQKLYEFCPDMVDQGAGTVANAAKALKESQRFFLWWD